MIKFLLVVLLVFGIYAIIPRTDSFKKLTESSQAVRNVLEMDLSN